ncbi:MAG: ATP-dependent DNA helicase RecQ [Alphaproteobacteria bacterium MarineAlpha9_Bin3]|nr:MAG: ATP-dependent DNA helicase RecQ [Alphaproteobacteria bacterium MarineAlpha9_Bin3]|tara:strand:+ start:12151 stop:13938 length:1788 start_codon:yes stop_codon:yes gene_type:complete
MQALQILNNVFGYNSFRSGQEEIINMLLNKNNILAVMPTGAGKSLCYQIPALIFKRGTIVVSPLVALMDDQILALKEIGVSADRIHSHRGDKLNKETINNFKNGKIKILYLSPENLMSDKTLTELSNIDIDMFAIDEAHCISKWGVSFRPQYEQLSKLSTIYPNAIIAGFTATADKITREDIVKKLNKNDTKIFVQGFDRPNLSLAVEQKDNWKKQILFFLENKSKESGIIYCLSRKQTEDVSIFLNKHNHRSIPYHAGQEGTIRKKNQEIFMNEEGVIIVATIAFGMGIDKANVRFVAHLSLPSSIEAYYQEIGRAGRDGHPADTLLLYGLNDLFQRRRFIESDGENIQHKLRENKRLDSLLAYCETPTCRKKSLLAYFDEKVKECKNCDNCINPPKMLDGTKLAQMVLSAIYRSGQIFGAQHIINILLGNKTEKILQKNHDKVKTFGIGSDYKIDFWQGFIRQLISAGHLIINIKKFGCLQITESGYQILKDKEYFNYKKIETKKSQAPKLKIMKEALNLDANSIEILSSLKQLRLNISKENSIPAFVVFSDSSLVEMATVRPKSLQEMLKINGVGPSKLKKYGPIFLTVINK